LPWICSTSCGSSIAAVFGTGRVQDSFSLRFLTDDLR
jgi:hypothetical protein